MTTAITGRQSCLPSVTVFDSRMVFAKTAKAKKNYFILSNKILKIFIEDMENISKGIAVRGFQKPLLRSQEVKVCCLLINCGCDLNFNCNLRSRRLPRDYLDETLRAINAR